MGNRKPNPSGPLSGGVTQQRTPPVKFAIGSPIFVTFKIGLLFNVRGLAQVVHRAACERSPRSCCQAGLPEQHTHTQLVAPFGHVQQ